MLGRVAADASGAASNATTVAARGRDPRRVILTSIPPSRGIAPHGATAIPSFSLHTSGTRLAGGPSCWLVAPFIAMGRV
jgi:hypothetical protein